MSDEYESKGLDDLFTSSSDKKSEVTEPKTPASDDHTEDKAQEQDTTKAPDLDKLLKDFETTNKRLNDTQKYANTSRQAALKYAEKLHELGEITDDELTEARKGNAPMEQTEFQSAVNDFHARFANVKDFLEDNGHNPEELMASFDTVFGKDPSVMKEFLDTAPEKRVKYVMNKGKEGLEFFKALKQYGTLPAAMAAIKKAAKEEAEKDKETSDNTGEDRKIGGKPRLEGGAGSTGPAQYQSKPLSNLMD